MPLPPELAREAFAYLTTTGAVTGLPREIEIWFAAGDGAIHLISGGGRRARWVGNLLARPDATLRIGDRTLRVRARLPLPPGAERDAAIDRLHEKYGGQVPSTAEDWRQRAYIVALDAE